MAAPGLSCHMWDGTRAPALGVRSLSHQGPPGVLRPVFFLIHLSVNKYSGCFHVLVIVNNAGLNMYILLLI